MSPLSSSDDHFLHSIDDLTAARVDDLLAAAAEFERSGLPDATRRPFSVGLLFLSASLRTRVGFAVAATRLEGSSVEVLELRGAPGMSAEEGFDDTLRVLSGMVDVAVVRVPFELERDRLRACLASAYVNAGDGNAHHPTQALIDLYAINRARGAHRDLSIAICGDLGTRTARSLIELMDLSPPRELALIAPAGRDRLPVAVGPELDTRISRRPAGDFEGLDILYMAGLPARSSAGVVGADVRKAFALDAAGLAALAGDAVVLAPMPVIDEIVPEARSDPRVKVFEQSDRAVFMRMAILDALTR